MRQVNHLLIIVVFYFVSIGLDTSRLRLGTSFVVQRFGELNVKVFL